MTFHGAVVTGQGRAFSILSVQRAVLDSPTERARAERFAKKQLGDMPVVLMARTVAGTPTYYGPAELVNYLKDVPFKSLPWKEYETK